MADALRKRYWTVIFNQAEATAQYHREHEQWQQTQDDIYLQIRQFYVLTGGLPVAGDYLQMSNNQGPNYQGLRIEKRRLYSSTDESEEMLLVYEIEAEEMEELEEYQEGDLVDDED